MHQSEQKQQFSFAYVRAVASLAGCSVTKPEVDDDSVDLSIATRLGKARPRLELQVKATTEEIWNHDPMSFEIKKKNYDELQGDNFLVPRILVVVCLPREEAEWSEQNEERLIMRRCGYYLSLRTLPERDDVDTSVTVTIPRHNLFTVASLRHIMSMIDQGVKP